MAKKNSDVVMSTHPARKFANDYSAFAETIRKEVNIMMNEKLPQVRAQGLRDANIKAIEADMEALLSEINHIKNNYIDPGEQKIKTLARIVEQSQIKAGK